MEMASRVLLAGIGATAAMDAWTSIRRRVLAIPAPDYALVGRWMGHMPRGRFRHPAIANAAPVHGERLLGWSAHYAIGIAFAALLALVAGPGWFRQPTPLPALLVGIGTTAAPFLLMQPGMGAGFFASRTPRPTSARVHSLLNHIVFGLGLWISGLALHALPVP